jgi:hypothetical protein
MTDAMAEHLLPPERYEAARDIFLLTRGATSEKEHMVCFVLDTGYFLGEPHVP